MTVAGESIMDGASGTRYDEIVIGAGTAGSIVAARLSEDPRRRVLLLEAGCDFADRERMPGELLDSRHAVTERHNWDLQVTVRGGPRATARPYPLAKVVGGGSAINAAVALCPRREDFEDWVRRGNPSWSWEAIEPYFAKVLRAEATKEQLPVETAAPSECTELHREFHATCLRLGFDTVDLHRASAPGVGVIPKNVHDGRRVSVASVYLDPVRARPNLTIRGNCSVERLILDERSDDAHAVAVQAIVEGRRVPIFGGRVVLCAGAINSPTLLLRSGIGPAAALERLGVRVALDLPGVGRHLVDHPAVCLWGLPRNDLGDSGEAMHQVMLQQRSSASEARCDLQLFMLSDVRTHQFPPLAQIIGSERAAGVSAVLTTPASTGEVCLASANAEVHPRVALNCASDPADIARLMVGVRLAWKILHEEGLAARVDADIVCNQRTIDSDAALESMIRATVRGSWHPVGTLRMGAQSDPLAVVDEHGRIRGASNIVAADASVMPSMPSVPTNLTCMIIGERIAFGLCGESCH